MNKDISIIGIGKLGLCLALNLEKSGYNITGVDLDQQYINNINRRTLQSDEKDVQEYLINCNNFTATTDIQHALANDVIFITVATPSLASGRYDHTQIDRVVNQIITFGKQSTKKYLVINCTTMPGYCASLQNRVSEYNYEICFNPEFIAQGTIIHDQQYPDIVLIGCITATAYEIVSDIYANMCKNTPSYHKMNTTEAEITKIALNCFLTTKISYANMVGDLAISTGCSPDVILTAIGSDSRVGSKYLKHGFGYGGPCFPRDNRAFGLYCEENGVYPHISYATDQSNKSHLLFQVKSFINASTTNKIQIDSITYKPESTIIEESQYLKYALELADKGVDITIKERKPVIQELQKLYGNKFKYIIK